MLESLWYLSHMQHAYTVIGTASTNSVESDLGCTRRINFDNMTLTLRNVMLTSQKVFMGITV